MKKITFLFFVSCFSVISLGCGDDATNTVIEAPAVEENTAIEGMTDEEYNKAMEADMQ